MSVSYEEIGHGATPLSSNFKENAVSIKVTTHVWDHSKQRGTALLVMLSLADWSNDGGYCDPAIVTIARKVRIKERQVHKVLAKLVEAGELEVLVGKGHWTKNGPTNMYIVRTPDKTQWDQDVAHDLTDGVQGNAGVHSRTPVQQGSNGVTKDQGVHSSTPITLKTLKKKDSSASPTAVESNPPKSPAKPRERNLAYDSVVEAFPHTASSGGVVQTHIKMLTGVSNGKNDEWDKHTIEPGLSPYEIHLFGKWMKSLAEDKDITAPRKPSTIAVWVGDWRTELREEREEDIRLACQMPIRDPDTGEDKMITDKEVWREYYAELDREKEAIWLKDKGGQS